MRISVFTKLIACYIILLVVPFLLLETVGPPSLRSAILDEQQSFLFQKANAIANNLMPDYYSHLIPFDELETRLMVADEFLNVSILLTNREGTILFGSSASHAKDAVKNLNEANPNLLVQAFTQNVTIAGFLDDPSLCVVLPLAEHMEIHGYLLLASPMSQMQDQYHSFINSVKYFFIPLSLLSFLVFFLLYLILVYPLNKLVKAAKNYASGNYGYHLALRSGDEFQTFANALSYMAGELNNLEDYRKNFIANISHDFRSPLTSIKGYVEAMLDGTIPCESRDKYLQTILFETERLTKLTKDLLELNGFENRRTGFDISTFDINLTIKKTAESFEGVCLSRNILLQLEFDAGEILVDADMGKIQQVLYNLLDNAIKFSYDDSIIGVSTSTKGDKAYICVKDNGVGIPNEFLGHIWERFFKIDSSRGVDKKGTGLGLSIAKEILHVHGENITVDSTEGVGSEFVFSLPLH